MPNPAPTRRRPDLDLELSRCRAVFTTASKVVTTTAEFTLDVRALSDQLARSLSGTPAPIGELDATAAAVTNRTVVTGYALQSVHSQCLDALEQADTRFAELTGARSPLRSDKAQLAALQKAGIGVSSLAPGQLSPYRRRLVVRALQCLRTLSEVEAFVRTELLPHLVVAYDAAERAERPAVLRTLADDGIDGQLLFDALVRFEAGRHISLIHHQANKLAGSYPAYRAEDLFSWGYRGLLAALHGYSPAQWAFSTYACVRIVGAIQDGVRQESPVPKRLGTYARQVQAVQARLGQELGYIPSQSELARAVALERLRRELGRTPTVSELADRIESEVRQLSLLPRLQAPASIDNLVDSGGLTLSGPPDPADEAMRTMVQAAVRHAVDALPAEEAEAVRLLDLEGLTLEEAGKVTGATSRQLRSRRDRGRGRLIDDLAAWV